MVQLSLRKLSLNVVLPVVCFLGLYLFAAFFIVVDFLSLWFQVIKDTSAVRSDIDDLPMILSQAVGNILASGLITQIGYWIPFIILGRILSSVGAGLLTKSLVSTRVKTWIGYQIIFGLGIGFRFQQPVPAAQTVLSLEGVPIETAFAMFKTLLEASIFTSIAQNTSQIL